LIRMGCEDGTNMILYGMLRSECRWLEINKWDTDISTCCLKMLSEALQGNISVS
jgi:hypothetical protein